MASTPHPAGNPLPSLGYGPSPSPLPALSTMAQVDAFHEEEALGKAYDSRLMRRLVRYLSPYRWQVALAILVLTLASATQVWGDWRYLDISLLQAQEVAHAA